MIFTHSKKSLIVMLFISAALLVVGSVLFIIKPKSSKQIDSFAECKNAGYPIQESYPERCITPEGNSFVNPEQIVPSQPISMTGELICLPHKNTDGPQTLECAFGIQNENGENYAISDPEMKFVTAMTNGQSYQITGLFTPESESKYDIVGTIELISISDAFDIR